MAPARQDWPAAARIDAAAELLREFPSARLTVTGTCMEPEVRAGSRVLLESRGRRPPRFGDVVLTRQGGELRLHRLVWAPSRGGGWRTQADRAATCDPRLDPADVLATVVAVEGSPRPPRRPLVAARALLRSLLRRAVRRRARRA